MAQEFERVSLAVGKVGLALVIVGFFAATFGAALETALSCGYTISQYFGWQWGKLVRPREASRFHLLVLASVATAVVVGLSAVEQFAGRLPRLADVPRRSRTQRLQRA